MVGLSDLLKVENLTSGYYTQSGVVIAVTNVNFEVRPKEIFAIAGESGCGKSSLALSIYGALKYPGKVFRGHVYLKGQDILSMSQEELRGHRMRDFSYVPQFAMDALDPVTRIGEQMIKAALSHGVPEGEARRMIREKLDLVRLPPEVLSMYPQELSGGMRQRAVIATSVLLNPDLVILDEPTTGLDVLVQYEILRDLKRIQRELGLSYLIISHDVSMLMMLADRIGVMYAGEFVEVGGREEVLKNPSHPYTMLLLNSLPSLIRRRERLLSIPGNPPTMLSSVPMWCRFVSRCPFKFERCEKIHPKEYPLGDGHRARCLLHSTSTAVDLSSLPLTHDYYAEEELQVDQSRSGAGEMVMKVENLSKTYFTRKGLVGTRAVDAVTNVSFELKAGVITALVGGSGHGKSTIAKILSGLLSQTSGRIFLMGRDVSKHSARNTKWYRQRVQMIFQDPYSSLDPRHDVLWHVARPLLIHGRVGREGVEEEVRRALTRVGLKPPEKFLRKYPHELSGGERQRVAIARAIAVGPRVLLADEPVSMLDASLRAGILNLIKGFRNEGVSVLYITHDIATVSYIADEVLVIYRGQIVERGPVGEVISNPTHEYTKRLMEAVPDPYKRIEVN